MPERLQEAAEQYLGRDAKDVRQIQEFEDVEFPLTNFQIGHAALLQLEGSGKVVLCESGFLALVTDPVPHAATIGVT